MPSEFRTLPLSPPLLSVLEELGFERLTPIQEQSIPPLLAGRDLVGRSRTGSGKTAAFALPILEKVRLEGRELQALVLCPTRELCAQVARAMRTFGRRLPGLQVLVLAGGQPIRPQESALEKGAHVAVGTPGRVLDLLRRGTLDARNVATVVLDEADRMLDMGFERDMNEVLDALPRARQSVFFSATFPPSFDAMSRAFQRDPVRVTVEDEAGQGAHIEKRAHVVPADRKLGALIDVLAAHPHESALVFCNFKATVVEVEAALRRAGRSAEGLHGDLEQFQRDTVMAKFRNGSTRILVATDVAARGLDIEGLDLVVDYELAPQPEVYVHRIGRTGRAGKEGLAISLVTPREASKLAALEERLGLAIERAPLGTGEARDEGDTASVEPGEARMDTLRISGGRKEKVRPGDILGALTGEAGGLDASDVGKIEIHDHFAYVAVSKRVSGRALESLSNGRIKGRRFRVSLVP
ncbi:MAG: ATP-dependent RNA helicase DbpA [Polyangiales bacterium]